MTRTTELPAQPLQLDCPIPGYNYLTLSSGQEVARQISNLFAPAYLTESAGLVYEPNDDFDLRLGVLTLRQITAFYFRAVIAERSPFST